MCELSTNIYNNHIYIYIYISIYIAKENQQLRLFIMSHVCSAIFVQLSVFIVQLFDVSSAIVVILLCRTQAPPKLGDPSSPLQAVIIVILIILIMNLVMKCNRNRNRTSHSNT